jgi:DNA-binding Lrp family transcriptional regulator
MDANDVDFQIMATVEETGALTIGKIAENTHMSVPKVQQRMLGRYGLVAGGFMKKVSASGE